MKILHFLHNINTIGGAHIHVLELSKYQKKLGNNVKIISYNIDNNKRYSFGKSYKKGSIDILEFNCHDDIPFMGLPKHTKFEENIFYDYLKKEKTDIIHMHIWYSPLSLSISKIAKNLQVKVFLTKHTYYTICPDNWLFKNSKVCDIENLKDICTKCDIYEKISKNTKIEEEKLFDYRKKQNLFLIENYVNKVICPSKTLFNNLIKFGIKRQKLKFIRHGIKKEKIISNKKNKKIIIFGFIGRLSKIKGFEILDNVLNYLGRKYNNFELLIVGGTRNSDVKIGEKRNYKINILKDISNKDIYKKFYSKIDFLIIPSLWKETGPLILLEAFSQKIPVIGNDIGGIKEQIKNGKNGFLYNNKEDLKKILEKILNKKLKIEKRGFYVKSLESYAKNIIKLYEIG